MQAACTYTKFAHTPSCCSPMTTLPAGTTLPMYACINTQPTPHGSIHDPCLLRLPSAARVPVYAQNPALHSILEFLRSLTEDKKASLCGIIAVSSLQVCAWHASHPGNPGSLCAWGCDLNCAKRVWVCLGCSVWQGSMAGFGTLDEGRCRPCGACGLWACDSCVCSERRTTSIHAYQLHASFSQRNGLVMLWPALGVIPVQTGAASTYACSAHRLARPAPITIACVTSRLAGHWHCGHDCQISV